MDEAQRQRITRFINDPATSEAVYSVLLKSFLKKKGSEDTETKAARFIATELLAEAWQVMESLKNKQEQGENTVNQVGL